MSYGEPSSSLYFDDKEPNKIEYPKNRRNNIIRIIKLLKTMSNDFVIYVH